MPAVINKNIKQIITDDLRTYLTNYQGKNDTSRLTTDNTRRIPLFFFAWFEDENYILKSTVRRIHKIKTVKNIREIYTNYSD